MDKKKAVSSSSSSFDHIFGPRGNSSSSSSSSTSSSTSGLFKSIFPPPSPGMGRQMDLASRVGAGKYHHTPNEGGHSERGERNRGNYDSEEAQPCNLSSSIYYGGQENYSPRLPTPNPTKKEGEDQGNSKTASRGNWWEGSLYY